MMVLGGGELGRRLGHEGKTCMNGIGIFIKEAQIAASPLSRVKTR